MSQQLFFISGITGHVGGAAAKQLLAQGHKVRSLVRNAGKAAAFAQLGAEIIQGDFTDSTAMAAALEGVDGAFVMVPPHVVPQPGFPESKAVIASLAEALTKTPVPRLAVLSSIGSEKESGLGLITATHLLEEALKPLGIPTAVVRAGGFFENYLSGLGPAAATGANYSFYAPLDRPVPMIASEDIGKQIATLLAGGWDGNKIIELGTDYTPAQIADAMAETLGRPVTAHAVLRERWSATFESFGFPAGGSWAYEEMIDGFNSGWIHFGVEGTEAVAATLTAAQVFAANKPTASAV